MGYTMLHKTAHMKVLHQEAHMKVLHQKAHVKVLHQKAHFLHHTNWRHVARRLARIKDTEFIAKTRCLAASNRDAVNHLLGVRTPQV